MTDKWRGENGKFITKGLFYEMSYMDPSSAVFTVKDEDYTYKGKTYKSFKKMFLEKEDPTYYRVATEMLGGWKHWKAIEKTKYPMMQELLEDCKEELEVKLRSQGVRAVAKDAVDCESKSRVQSAKWLSDKGWSPAETKKRGRPSKAEVERETKIAAKMDKEVADMASRLVN